MIQKHWDNHNDNECIRHAIIRHTKVWLKCFFFYPFCWAMCVCELCMCLHWILLTNAKTTAVLLRSVHHFKKKKKKYCNTWKCFIYCGICSVHMGISIVLFHCNTHSLPRYFLQCDSFSFEFYHLSHSRHFILFICVSMPQCTLFLVLLHRTLGHITNHLHFKAYVGITRHVKALQ